MTSLLDLIIVLVLLMLFFRNSGLKHRMKRLEDAHTETLKRLERIENQGTGKEREGEEAETGESSPSVAASPATAKAVPAPATNAPPKQDAAVRANTPPRAFVFTHEAAGRFGHWLLANWTVALAALSLALGGVFMVQYGVENGLLTPLWRVIGALVIGALLIGAGEFIRQRHGDESADATRFLPSTFTGAGLITLFAAVLAARLLYGLISPETTLAGLVLVSVLAVVLGWLYGSVLSAVGIIGATAAPFLVGGDSQSGWLFFYYFALIAIAGLAVDSVKRWAWVSALVLIATSTAATVLYLGTGEALHYAAFLVLAWLASVIIPVQNFMPSHAGQTVLATLAKAKPRADFPTRIVAAMTLFVCAAASWLTMGASSVIEANAALGVIYLVLAATLLWMHRAEALADMPLIPAVAFIGVIAWQATDYGPVFAAFGTSGDPARFLTVMTVLATIISVMAFWRMTKMPGGTYFSTGYALGAAVFAPAVIFVLEFLWMPAETLGDIVWSIHILAVAAIMAVLSDRALRGGDVAERQLRAALFAIAALSLLALALFVVLTQTALTLALGVVVILTVALDRRFDLPAVGVFTKVALAVIAWRLVANPGFFWAVRDNTAWTDLVLAYGGTLALLYVAWRLSVARARISVQLAIETSVWTIAAVFACTVLQRLWPDEAGLLATVWAIAMLAQINRLQTAGKLMRYLRITLAIGFGLFSALLIAVPLTLTNPLLDYNPVSGPLVFDSLAINYLPLAVILAAGAWKLRHLGRIIRAGFGAIAVFLGGFYAACEIRRFWRGDDLSVAGVTQPELYTYTVAMIIVCAIVLLISFSRRSNVLRKIAMTGIGLTIAKVFLIDISGLEGLFRVVTFLGLGLALVTLAWLDRTMSQRWSRGDASPDDISSS